MLRLPKYHNELNPFEFAWPVVKTYVTNNITPAFFNINAGKFIVNKGLTEVTPDKWRHFIELVKNAEIEMYNLDHNIDNTTDSYLKYVGNPRFPGDEISSGPSDSESDIVF